MPKGVYKKISQTAKLFCFEKGAVFGLFSSHKANVNMHFQTRSGCMSVLKMSFFQRETTEVATDLLGCVLNRVTDKGLCLRGRIVETEAYLGLEDDSCHSFGGRKTERVKTMYLPGGHAYIYFIYGMYYCFNIVTEGREQPSAVLIRAIEPLTVQQDGPKNRSPFSIANGPGKLCRALNIDKSLNEARLDGHSRKPTGHSRKPTGHSRKPTGHSRKPTGPRLYVEKGKRPETILTSPRVGLSPMHSSCHWPLRFYIEDSPFVSNPPSPKP